MIDPFSLAAGWIQEQVLLPLLYAVGVMEWEEISYGWALFACYGAAQVAITFAICLPLERWRPVERWPDQKAVWVDVLYTLISRVGVLPLVTFVLFYQIQVMLNGWLTDHGWVPPTLERFVPALLGHQSLTFFLYAIILDFAEYWRHRLSHTLRLVVGAALAAPCAAADDVLVGRPQPPAGRPDRLRLVHGGRAADRHSAAAVPVAGAAAAAAGKPVARQRAAFVRAGSASGC